MAFTARDNDMAMENTGSSFLTNTLGDAGVVRAIGETASNMLRCLASLMTPCETSAAGVGEMRGMAFTVTASRRTRFAFFAAFFAFAAARSSAVDPIGVHGGQGVPVFLNFAILNSPGIDTEQRMLPQRIGGGVVPVVHHAVAIGDRVTVRVIGHENRALLAEKGSPMNHHNGDEQHG